MKMVLRYLWGLYPIIIFRKTINTFRPTVWFVSHLFDVYKKRNKDAAVWENEDHYKSNFYSKLGGKEKIFINYVAENTETQDRILDVCCNQGRFLFELKKRGYLSLYGFDIMGSAINKLKENPEYLSDIMEVEHVLAQDYFSNKSINSYDWAITYTATIELIHPEFDIFSELGRTVKKGMFLVLNEDGHSYPRFYRILHWLNGFKICSIVPISDSTVLIHSIKRHQRL